MASTITADPHYPPNEYRIPLQDQWNLITVPVNASIAKDQITIRNNSIDYNFTEAVNHGIIVGTLFGWDRENQTYYIANNLGFEPGKGYWLWAYYPCSLIIHSDVRGDGYITKLQSQWNMMGQTYNSSLALKNLRVLYNGTSYSWANATTANNEEGHPLLIGVLFKWDGANQWYDLSTGFTPGEGYWMYAYHNCSLRQVIDAPVIIDHSLDTTGTGNSYVCNASVSDPDGVKSVWLEYWYGSSPHSFVQMNPTGVGSYYEKLLTIPSSLVDSLHYIIVANDTKNHWNTTGEQAVVVTDDDAPVIANVLADPSSTLQGNSINISCDVTDNIAVHKVQVNITYPDLSSMNLSMEKGTGYYLNRSYTMDGTYEFFIWTNDTSNNSNKSSVHTFTINFAGTYTLTITKSGTGSGTVEINNTGPYYFGAKVTLWANASSGSLFTGWNGALSGTTTPQTLIMNANKSVDAQFTLIGPRGWIYYKKITVNHSQVNQSLVNFPILVSTTDTDLVNHAQPDARDVQFWDVTNTTRYHHEIEKYNQTPGEFIAWVNVTYLSATQDTIIWMKYGNTTCGSQENIAGTWDGNYVMVQHLNETGNTVYDSTSYGNNGLSTGTDFTAMGKIDGGRQYNDNDKIVVNNFIHSPNALTAEAWVYRDATAFIYILCKGTYSSSSDWILYLRNGYPANQGIDFSINGHGSFIRTGDTPINRWFYLTATYNSGSADLYFNGTKIGSGTGWPSINNYYPHLGMGNDYVGNNGGTNPMTQVRLDELRVSKNARNSSWIKTSYNTMSQPTSFIHVGVEEQMLLTLTITKNGTGLGTIEVQPSGPYYYGAVVTLWANASVGSTFTSWSGALTGTITPQTLVVDANKAVNAMFSYNGPLTLTITKSGSGSGTVETNNTGLYYYGTKVTLWANASSGSIFAGWNGALSGTTTPQTLIMNANKSVDAHFMFNGPLTLTITKSGTGSGTVQTNISAPYYYGAKVKLWANASTGSTFIGWRGALSGIITPQTLTMDANKSVDARFNDTMSPTIGLNFAGNPSDSGGPYYLPGTNTPAPEGYYTNASYQKEKWIQIKCTATDNVGIDKVWLHWRNGTQWTNNTYQLTHTTGNYYEINMSTNIAPGPKYSFDLLAVDTSGNTMLYRWLKIGADTTAVDDRRYVQLGGTPTNISYTPYYFYPAQYKYTTGYGPGHNMTNDDTLHHDQGPDGTLTDSGYLLGTLPTNVVQERYCTMYVGYWFDETVTAQPGTIKNIYHHFWWHTNNHNLTVAYGKSDAGFYRTEAWGQSYPTNTIKARTNISYNSITYYLESALMKITSPQSYTDNDIYEFFVEYLSSTETNPTVINNRSIQSFVVFNVPDNTTLQGQDTDADGLTDYQELYGTFTNPFVQDTDNDGVSDYYETVSGSDPNDYKDTMNPFPVLSMESPQNQSRVQPLNPPLSISMSQSQNHLMNVTFRTNASGTWQTIGTNLSVPNGTYSQTPTTMNSYSTTYYWSVHCNAGSVWTNKTYHFTTWAEPRGWIYYKKITVNHSLVNQSLTNFPILIMTTDTDLVNHAQPDARDVQFWDATNTTRYHHEIEKYNETTGEFIAWVNITHLGATQDTIIWMRYGNTTCGSQENIVGTWDGNYVMVQHLNEAGNTVYDSTSYGNNGLSTGTDFTATGKIDGGRQYNDNDRIVVNNFIHSPNALTAEAWVYRDATAFIYISCKGTYSTSSDWILYLRNNQPANQGIDFSIKNHTSYIRKGDTPVNRWFYLTATYNSGSAALYFNGTQIGSGTGWPSIPNSYLNLGIGNDYLGTNGGENPMTQVKLDEFRVSKIARNSSWIKTSYNTMSQPISFIHIGSEEQITYSITVTQSGTGSGTVEHQPSGPYHFGTIVKLWANASVGSTFTGWSGALSGTVSPQTLTMDDNKAVNAQFTHLNQAPTHNTPLLISEYGTNTTDEKLICTNQSTVDPEGNPVYNTYHWLKNGVSVPNLLLSFNTANTANVKDYSGYKNNGTVINGTTWISSGKIGGAYKFDGTNDYITIPDASSLDGDGTWTAMTIECWINPGKDGQSTPTIIEKRSGTTASSSYQIGWSSTNAGRLYTGYYRGTFYNQTSTTTSTPILYKNNWYYVVSTYKSGEGIKLYVNGSLYASLSNQIGSINPSNNIPVNIGRRRTETTRFFNGSVDEVKIYPFTLTPQQISQNYNDSKNGYSNVSKIVKEQTSIGDLWRCEVTPSDGQIDGLTKASNPLTIVPVYTLTITKSGTGLGTVEVNRIGPYFSGTVVTLWANASVGSTFTGWNGSLSGTTTPETLTMNGNKTIDAQFTLTGPYTLTLTPTGTGSGTIQVNNTGPHYYGAKVKLWANASVGSTFTGWFGALIGTTTPQTLTMDGNKTVNARFTLNGPYTLTITMNGTGSGTVQTNISAPYYYGAKVKLWANASVGSTFIEWYGVLSGTTSPETLVMTTDKTVVAKFTSTPFLTINSNFDSGSIGSYTINGNSINYTLSTEHLINSGDYYTYWTNFKVQNTQNKNITFRITNANLVPFLANTGHEVQMVYSYDGMNWSRFTNHTYAAGIYRFWKNFTANQVQIATFFPFSYTEMHNYLETTNASQFAVKTVLGKSTQNRDIDLLTITNPSISNATKKIVYIIGRQHSAETTSSHMLKGMIDFLISNNSDARRLRDSFIWYIVPMVNPDGVYLGYTRGTSLLRDPNDDWGNSQSVEINIVKNHLSTTKNNIGVDFFIDWHSHISDTSWYNFIYSPPGNTLFPILSQWTDFDSQTSPGVGSSSARGYATNLGIFTFTFEPTPHLSTWTLDTLHEQGMKTAFAIDEYFPLLLDSEFNISTSSEDLRANATTRDWFESRNNDPLLVGLDTNNIMGNLGKKAGFYTQDIQHYTYLSQEFRTRQTGRFTVSLDILIDSISIYYDAVSKEAYNRTGFVFIGSDDSDHTNGPCTTSNERFVFLTFFDNNPVENNSDIVLKARESLSQAWNKTVQWTTVMANLSYDTWYRLTLDVDMANRTYDVYVNDVLVAEDIAGYNNYVSNSISHLTFYAGGTARGTFYVDNVFSLASERHSLKTAPQGNGSVSKTPGEATYRYGAPVQITATADLGWTFDHWTGDLSGNTNPKTIALTSDMNVTAVFAQNHYTLTTNTVGTGSITRTPPQSTFVYNESVMLQAVGGSGWSFTHWTGNLTGHVNPITLQITQNTVITAHFSNTALYTLTTNAIGSGTVECNPDRAIYEPSATVILTPVGNRGWTFNNWTGNVPSGHTHDNPLTITMNANKLLNASFNSSEPTVLTTPVLNITSNSATLKGYINDTGGENCSVWFEWDYSNVEECMGTIATGTVCKDGRSILHKNRHYYYDNVKPYYYHGTNYSFFGIGDYGTTGLCRMGQNEKGLAIVNMDVGGTITHWKYQTDWGSGSQDNDAKICLGNFSTVRNTAYFLAKHGFYYGNGSTNGQYLIISSEPGVGAIVAIDRVGHTNITWINNTYAGCANSWYCDGKWDTGDYNDKRAKIIMNDIVQNGTSSDGDHLLNWQDIVQRVAKDVSGKEKGTGSYSYAGQIACGYSRSSTVHVAGNSSLNSSIHMSWLGIGQTTQVAIFLPLYAGNLHSSSDIPSNFTTANGGKGIQPYADVKRNYARGNLADGNFYCSRVREILKYTSYNENLTFNAFDNLMDTIMYSANQQEARNRLDAFMEVTLPKALRGYIANSTKSSTDTFKHYPQGVGYFTQAITGLKPGTTYYVKAWANNTGSSSNGTILRFMTLPQTPTNAHVHHFGSIQVNLSWTKGNGSYFTIIERNATGVSSWARGEGIQVYNGTANQYADTTALPSVQYYYQFWSYTTEKGLHQYSSTFASAYTGYSQPPQFSNMFPSNGSTDLPLNTNHLNITIRDPEGNHFDWTVQTSPNIGSSFGNGATNGTKTCTISGLLKGKTYTWFVNATDGISWMRKTYSFTTMEPLLTDSDFNASSSSAELRANGLDHDWYESRNDTVNGQNQLTLNETTIAENTGKKAKLLGTLTYNTYLSQEFSTAQTGTFSVHWDIYIDEILDRSTGEDRSAYMLIGDDSGGTNGPCSAGTERFVYMAFVKAGGGTTGTADLVDKIQSGTSQPKIATINLDQWYTIKVNINVLTDKYDVYVYQDGFLIGNKMGISAATAKTSLTHLSFATWNDGGGTFYVDNVYANSLSTNTVPVITNELPTNSSTGVSISTSQLSVQMINDDGDLMDYTIKTNPDIGSSNGFGVKEGTKTCNISGLAYGTIYAWHVNATDRIVWTNRSYTFMTETSPVNNPPTLSSPDPANESTGVPITTTSLSITIQDTEIDPFNWSITTLPDIGSNSGTDDSNGVKTCTISGLTYTTTYTWYVKTTDGNGWTNYSYIFTTESAPVNNPPIISGPIPANNSIDMPVNTALINITIQDPEGNPIDWTIQTSPNIGSNSATGGGNGSKTCSISGLKNYTTYRWFVNATDGTSWTKKTFTFTTKGLLADPGFDASIDSSDLKTDILGIQDWYESRNDLPTLLTLDTTNIGGNSGKKAALINLNNTKTAYLSQEFSSAQTSTFSVSLDIYIAHIYDYVANDRTAHIFIGNNTGGTNSGTSGPCSTGIERFVCLAFYDSTPDSGNDIILKARQFSNQSFTNTSQWTTITTGLSYNTWYDIRLDVRVGDGTYDVYVNDVLKGSNIHKQAEYTSNYITYMSFYVGGYSRGDFYVDNVHSPAIN